MFSLVLKLATWAIICLAILLYLVTRKFYIGGNWGFIDGRNDESRSHQVNREQLETVNANMTAIGEGLPIHLSK